MVSNETGALDYTETERGVREFPGGCIAVCEGDRYWTLYPAAASDWWTRRALYTSLGWSDVLASVRVHDARA